MSTPLIDKKGRPFVFDGTPDELQAALTDGYRVDTGEGPTAIESLKGAASDLSESVNAVGLGALQGATAGGYGAYLGATQPHETKRAVLEAMEANPLATGAGELGGMLLSPLNKLAPAIEGPRAATLAGRLAQKVVGGAAVGSLYGAGNTVSDAALGDTQLTAERLVTGAGLGVVLGGLGGGVGGAIEEGAAKLLPKLGTVIKGGQSALDEIADDAAVRSTRAQQSAINKLGDDKFQAVADVLRDRGHLKLSPEAMAESLAGDREALGKRLGQFLDDAETAGHTPDHARTLQRLDDWFAKLDGVEQDAIKGEYTSARGAVEKMGTKGGGFRDFDALKQSIQERGKFSGPIPVDNMSLRLKRGLAGEFRDELDQQLLPKLGSDAAKEFTESKVAYGALKDAERLAASGLGRPGGAGYVGLKDLMSGAAFGSLSHPLGLAAAIGSKLLREHGQAIIARIADRLAKSPALEAVAQSFAKALPTAAPQLGRYGPSLVLAAQRSSSLALAQHMVTAQVDPEYAANAQLAGLRPETPDEHVASLGKAADIASIKAALKSHDVAQDDAMRHIVKGTKPPAATPVLKRQDFGSKQLRRDSQAAHSHIVGQIRQLAADPNALIDLVASNTGAIANAAPGVTAHLTAVADRAVRYLATQAEVPPKPGPMAHEWIPTEAERHKFALKLEAIQEPMSILRHAAKGMLTRGQIEAVSAVYPQFMEQIRTKALEQMTSGEKMPYQSRLMLSMLTGVDADGTTSPKAIAANQSAIAAASAKEEQPQPSDTKLGVAGRAATTGQKNELESEAA